MGNSLVGVDMGGGIQHDIEMQDGFLQVLFESSIISDKKCGSRID